MTQKKLDEKSKKSVADAIKEHIDRIRKKQEEIEIRTAVERNLMVEKQAPPKCEQKAQKQNQPRIIDKEKLEAYFKPQFKGKGNGSINNFEKFLDELETDRTMKEFAYIAKLCFDGSQMQDNRKPKIGGRPNFNEWYAVFCECVGCKRGTYKPNKLKEIPDRLAILFRYLE